VKEKRERERQGKALVKENMSQYNMHTVHRKMFGGAEYSTEREREREKRNLWKRGHVRGKRKLNDTHKREEMGMRVRDERHVSSSSSSFSLKRI
jgi:hypothetical protein